LDPKAKAKAKDLSHKAKAKAKDLDFGLKDQGQGQGLTSLTVGPLSDSLVYTLVSLIMDLLATSSKPRYMGESER